MKRVVSVSLGTSKRDKREEVTILGNEFLIERIGVDGDLVAYGNKFEELDGKVDALGVGGADIYVVVGDRRYAFSQIQKLAARAKTTPVVDGSGLKHTLERTTIARLQEDGIVDFAGTPVLLVSAADRFGMAQGLVQAKAKVVFGDFLFGIGIPIPIRSYSQVELLGKILLPIITRLPIQWFYPTGEKQETRSPKFPKYFLEADVICGDWHYIRKYMPDHLPGKTIITQTLRKADLDFLRDAGVWRAITTTPVVGGESFATNVMEGVIVATLGKRPEQISESEYLETLRKLEWRPNVLELNPKSH
jgi:hypothetical protein